LDPEGTPRVTLPGQKRPGSKQDVMAPELLMEIL
jgi:hypothetical protein